VAGGGDVRLALYALPGFSRLWRQRYPEYGSERPGNSCDDGGVQRAGDDDNAQRDEQLEPGAAGVSGSGDLSAGGVQ
jgi:hypothetical protein